jgi:hypothetical protein
MRKKTATLDKHFDKTLRRIRAEFERTGEIRSKFKCVTDFESFDLPVNWPNRSQKLPYVQRCGIPFVAGALIDTYSQANAGSATALACFRRTIPIAVSASL